MISCTGDHLESSFVEKTLVFLVDTKVNTRQQCAQRWLNSLLGCVRKSIASRLREEGGPPRLQSTGETHLECWLAPMLGSLKETQTIVERIQRRTMKMFKGLEHQIYEERLRAGTA